MKPFFAVCLLLVAGVAFGQTKFDESWASAVRAGSLDGGLESTLNGLRANSSASLVDRARASFFYARIQQHKAEVAVAGAAAFNGLLIQGRSGYQFAIANGDPTTKASAAVYLSLLEVLASGANGASAQARALSAQTFDSSAQVELDCSMWTVDQRYRILQSVPMSQFKPMLIGCLNGAANGKTQFRDAILESVASGIADWCRKNPGRRLK